MRGAIILAGVALVFAGAAPARASTLPPHGGMWIANDPHPLPMLASKLAVSVHGPIVEVVVTQRFENRSDRAIEAVYVFPLPADAAVSAMSMQLGARTITAAIERRADAQQRYEAAVTAGVGGALLEQERPDVFTQTVAAIPAHTTVEVTLRYDATATPSASARGEQWTFALPMVVAPRYVPGSASGRPTTGAGRAPDTDRAPDASRVTPATDPDGVGPTAVAIAFADPVDELSSPTHDLAIARDHASATFVDAHSDRDAILRWRAPTPAAGWVEQDGSDAFAAVVVEAAAPAASAAAARRAADWLIVLDRAATTRGDASLQPLVHAVLGALDPSVRVAIAGSDTVAAQPPAATRAQLDTRWAKPAGAFDLTRVLGALHRDRAAIVLISDGLVADDAAAIAAARGLGVPVHVIGIGPAPARGLLAAIASATAGTLRYATPGDDLAALARDVIADANTAAPALAVSWGTLAAHDVVPAALPRLGVGQAMLVVARVGRATGAATAPTANGRTRGEVFAFEPVHAASPPTGATTALGPLARRWAKLRLDDLLAARTPDANAVTAHALAFGLVSPFTAMVAIGTDVVVTGGVKHSVAVPVAVPAGMRWQEVHDQLEVAGLDDARAEEQGHVATKPPVTPTPGHGGRRTATAPKHKQGDANDPRGGSVASTPQPKPSTTTRPTVADHERAPTTPAPPPAATVPTQPYDGGSALGANGDNIASGGVSGAKPAHDDSDGDDDGDRAAPTPTPAPTNILESEALVEGEMATDSFVGARGPSWRVALGIAGGVELTGTHGLIVVDARIRFGRRRVFGLDAGLWLVDAEHPQARLLATAGGGWGRYDFTSGLGGVVASGGAGLAFGDSLRFTPRGSRVGYGLRYEGALLFHSGGSTVEHAVVLGIELRW